MVPVKTLLFFLISAFIIGCGGENAYSYSENSDASDGTKSSGNSDLQGSTIDPENETLTKLNKAIKENKVKGWSSAKSNKDYYLAVANYLRSLPIKCNDSRAYSGPAKSLKWNEQLMQAAKEHSDDMLGKNYLSHEGSDGSTPKIRVQNSGFSGSYYAENLAYQKKSGIPYNGNEWLGRFIAWIQSSSGHCSNLMSPYSEFMGMYESKSTKGRNVTLYWTQDFGKK